MLLLRPVEGTIGIVECRGRCRRPLRSELEIVADQCGCLDGLDIRRVVLRLLQRFHRLTGLLQRRRPAGEAGPLGGRLHRCERLATSGLGLGGIVQHRPPRARRQGGPEDDSLLRLGQLIGWRCTC